MKNHTKYKSYSDHGQDIWILDSTNQRKNGFFLDIGCRHPFFKNNTVLLETKNNWRGICVSETDIENLSFMSDEEEKLWRGFDWSFRPNTKFYYKSPLNIDYESILDEVNAPRIINYLSLEINPPEDMSKFLDIFPFGRFSFNHVTLHFDVGIADPTIIEMSDEFFLNSGYILSRSTNKYDRFYNKLN